MKSQIGRRTRRWVLCATGGLVIAGPSFLPADDPTPLRPHGTAATFSSASRSRSQEPAGIVRITSDSPLVHARSRVPVLREPGRLPPIEGSMPIDAIERAPASVQQTSGEDSEAARYMEALYAREVTEAALPEPYAPSMVEQQKSGLLKRFFGLFRRGASESETLSRQQLLPVPPAPTHVPVRGSYFPPPVPRQTPAAETVAAPPPAPPAFVSESESLEFNPFDDLPQTAGPPPAPPVSEELPMLGEEAVVQQPAGGGEFFDPFSELSEEEADRSKSPYTGLTLGDPSIEGADVAASPSSAESAAAAERFEPPIEKEASLAERVKAPPMVDLGPADPPAADPQVASESGSPELDEKMMKIKTRRHRQGLKGFCPVVLRDERDLRDTRPDFSAQYMGVTYHFSSAEAQQKFEAAPEKYAPIQGGTDVVLLVCEHTHARGSIEHAVWYRDRLYLFSDGMSMQTFKDEPSRYAQER